MTSLAYSGKCALCPWHAFLHAEVHVARCQRDERWDTRLSHEMRPLAALAVHFKARFSRERCHLLVIWVLLFTSRHATTTLYLPEKQVPNFSPSVVRTMVPTCPPPLPTRRTSRCHLSAHRHCLCVLLLSPWQRLCLAWPKHHVRRTQRSPDFVNAEYPQVNSKRGNQGNVAWPRLAAMPACKGHSRVRVVCPNKKQQPQKFWASVTRVNCII